ncbi:MAG: hypothetical protein WBF81_08945 [Thermoplasmata archaeon]
MSWAGMLRPGDPFPPALSSRLASLTAESGPPLRRAFGSWSRRYRRFTSNLNSAKIQVDVHPPGHPPDDGVQCVVHWVDAGALRSSDPGSVCAGDGWPVELWDAFTSEIDTLPRGSIAEKLRHFRDSRRHEGNSIVAAWREALRTSVLRPPAEARARGSGWIPVPVTLRSEDETTAAIVSWDPQGQDFPSLSDALRTPETPGHRPDLESQARYYLECTLATLHGVRFARYDRVEDEEYARSPEVCALEDSFHRLERERIADPRFGLLDRFG